MDGEPAPISMSEGGVRAVPLLWNGVPVVFWEQHDPRGALGRLTLAELAKMYDRRALRHVSADPRSAPPLPGWRLETDGRLTVRAAGNFAMFDGTQLSLSAKWRSAADRNGICLVLTTPSLSVEMARSRSLSSLRGRYPLFGGMVDIYPHPVPRARINPDSRYKMILGRNTVRPGSYILDTNVLIDIEHFHDGRLSDEQTRHDLRSLLLSIGDRDLIPGPAILESGQSQRGRRREPERQRHLTFAYERVLACTPEMIVDLFEHQVPSTFLDETATEHPGTFDHVDDEDLNVLPQWRRLHSTSYAMLLKILLLTPADRRFPSAADRFSRYEAYLSWLISDLPIADPYELDLAYRWFVGVQEPASVRQILKLLKFKPDPGKRAHAAWGAAWDLFMLRAIDGGLPTLRDAALVTADRSLADIHGHLTRVHASVRLQGASVEAFGSDAPLSQHLEQYDARIRDLGQTFMLAQLMRSVKRAPYSQDALEGLLDNVVRIADDLERRVLCG